MRLGQVVVGYGFVVLVYLCMILAVDNSKGYFSYFSTALAQLPVLMLLALASFSLRYLRWYWLLRWAGASTSVLGGWWAYLSGFAFTATPGKVGELVRIRYLGRLGIGSSKVVSAFVFERAIDLVVVLALSSLYVANLHVFWVMSVFVAVFLLTLVCAAWNPAGLIRLGAWFDGLGWSRLARLLDFLAEAIVGCRSWVEPVPMIVSLLLGFAAWSVTAVAFVWLLNALNIAVPLLAAFSAYPLAMLAGAASMLPGGVGSTEAAIVVQLQWHGVPTATALLAAVVVRLGTMWFSVILGFFAIFVQETCLDSKFANMFGRFVQFLGKLLKCC